MNKNIAIIVALSFLFYSCATKYLWKNTDPNEYMEIKYTKITEEELQKKDVKYIKDDNRHVYYLEKNDLTKFKDYTLRIFGTPVTVAVDTVSVIAVIGVLILPGMVADDLKDKCEQDPDCHLGYPSDNN